MLKIANGKSRKIFTISSSNSRLGYHLRLYRNIKFCKMPARSLFPLTTAYLPRHNCKSAKASVPSSFLLNIRFLPSDYSPSSFALFISCVTSLEHRSLQPLVCFFYPNYASLSAPLY